MKHLWMVLPMTAVLMTACNSHDDERTGPAVEPRVIDTVDYVDKIELTNIQQKYVDRGGDFAFRLLRTAVGKEIKNMIVSPLSMAVVLGMMANELPETVAGQIKETLGVGDASINETNEFFKLLISQLPRRDRMVTFSQGSALFVCAPYELSSSFLRTAADFYEAETVTLDFSSPDAVNRINQWALERTNGMIDRIVENVSPVDILYVLNAVYFKGLWSTDCRFDEDKTRKESFGNDGIVANMMHTQSMLAYAEDEGLQIVQLPYGNGAYSMTVILPREDDGMRRLLQQLDGSLFKRLCSNLNMANVDLKLPRFDIATDLQQADLLDSLGMDELTAEGVGVRLAANGQAVSVSLRNLKQKARLSVNEDGTEAAVATAGGMIPISMPVEMHVTHPFVFVISEQTTHAILFTGIYAGR